MASLKSSFLWMLSGKLIYVACQWLALVAIAKLGTPEIVGEFAFALAATSPIFIFFNLNMRMFQATDAKNEYVFKEYLSARLVQTAVALLTIALVTYFGGYTSSITKVVAAVSFYKAVESISDIYYGRLQCLEKMPRIGRSQIMRGLLYMLAVYMSMRMAGSVVPGAVLTALLWLLVLFLYDKKGVEPEVSIRSERVVERIWQVSKKCFPLGVVALLVSLNANIPVYVIKRYLDIGQLGIFSALVYFAIAGQFVTGALAQTVAPRLAQYYTGAQLDKFKSLQARLIGLGAGMAIVGVLLAIYVGEYVLAIFYNSSYAAHTDAFIWIMVSAGIGYAAIFLGAGLTVARRFREMLLLNIISVTATFVLCYTFVPEYGLIGAAWALAGSAAMKFMINFAINYWLLYSRPSNALM
jgi:O-antigen/teichoic acid export membrane protein